MDREWFGLREEGDVLPRGKDGETGLAMEMATSVDKSSFFRRLQRNVTVQWENTVAHRALRFFIFTGRSFLCFIIVLNLFELQSFYIHRFDTRVCVCVRVKKLSISFFLQYFLRTRLDFDLSQGNFQIDRIKNKKNLAITLRNYSWVK